MPEWWAGIWRWALIALGVAAAAYLLLDRGIANGAVTAAALAALIIGVVFTWSQPMALALMATPALLVTERLGVGASGLTVSDAALAAGFGSVILLSRGGFSPPMKAMLWLNMIYQFTSLFTVIVNPYPQNTVEWFHAWLLISGAMVMGWGLGRAGFARAAFALVLGMAAVIALGTFGTAVVQFAGGGFGSVYPAWPWPMHKNFAGGALAFAAFLAYVNPEWARLPRRWMVPLFWAFLCALLLTQSRQAAIGLIIVLLIHNLRQGVSRHGVLIVLLAIPAAVLVVQSVIEQIESQNRFNSVYQRLDWIREVYALWKHEPIFGHGLRYWYVHPSADFQPPQAELEVVASTGIVGLLGFGAMWLGFIVVLWRVSPAFGMLAFGSVLARIVQAQFDLFWVSAQVSIPFFIAGVCLGAQALHVEGSGGETSYWRERVTAADRKRARTVAKEARLASRLPRRANAYDRLVQGNTRG
ncbi:O-antigen ligase [Microbacterium sp. SD291]|uniref:O-antigen ligase family protein n=1 Tax=Microbacterium sp. SD291 TaxID=2782007 RepID=UPI001A97AA30|nr:O-antigen ligase family protein [Microbacterium sp. SD291]MBO0980968.1 O-antigen ligase family protein [Microbacterium sp. SD291]